jgi:hypothetical protein
MSVTATVTGRQRNRVNISWKDFRFCQLRQNKIILATQKTAHRSPCKADDFHKEKDIQQVSYILLAKEYILEERNTTREDVVKEK